MSFYCWESVQINFKKADFVDIVAVPFGHFTSQRTCVVFVVINFYEGIPAGVVGMTTSLCLSGCVEFFGQESW